jgi:hypothetical protein
MVLMGAVEFQAMAAAYAAYYGPMLELWRIVFLGSAILLAVVILIGLIFQRGLSAYL